MDPVSGFCCVRRSPAADKSASRQLPPPTRVKLPWESEPEKFNIDARTTPNKFENKSKPSKKSQLVDERDGSVRNVGLGRAESALNDATSSLSKAKHSVLTAKEELEQLKRKQADLTKELLKIETRKAEKDNVFSFLSRIMNPSVVANQMQALVQSLDPDPRTSLVFQRDESKEQHTSNIFSALNST